MNRRAIPKRVRYAVLERDGYRCRYCGAEATDAKLHVAHRMPVSKGGTNDIENLVTACEACNLGKHAFLPVAFLPNQRASAYATEVFGRACERFGAEAFTWRAFCLVQDFCAMEPKPELLLRVVLDSHDWASALAAMYKLAGYPPDFYEGEE